MTGKARIRTHSGWGSHKEIEYKGLQALSKSYRTALTDTGFLFSSPSCSYIHSEVSYPFYYPGEKEEPLDGLIAVTIPPFIQSSSFPNSSMPGRCKWLGITGSQSKLNSSRLLKNGNLNHLIYGLNFFFFLRKDIQFCVSVLTWSITKEFSISSISSSPLTFATFRLTVTL